MGSIPLSGRDLPLTGLLPAGVVDGIVCAAGAWQDDLGDGHKCVPLLKQGLDDPGQGLWRVDGRIVEEHDRPRAHPAHHPLGDLVRRDLLPVQAVTVPHSFKHLISGLYTFSKKVSGLLGSNTSLQVITVTRSSVSDKLIILCVQPGII